MKHLITGFFFACLMAVNPALANEESAGNEKELLRGIVNNIMDDNAAFANSHKPDYYRPFAEKQHPRATVVTCSDSRVHTHALDKTPDGDLFMVRNIGNQIITAEGSVEYGVHHLHTPLLIIVGHVACGAIKAALGDYSQESGAIKRELDSIELPSKNLKNDEEEEWLRGIKANVNNQVNYALKKFTNEVKEGKLTVIGAVYDFQNALHQGQGRLLIININGNSDSNDIMSSLVKITSAGSKSDKASGKGQAKKKSAPH